MSQRKAVKGYGKWRAELIETLPDGTQRYRSVKGLKPVKQSRRFIAEYEKRFRELYDQKLNDTEIGETLGFNTSTVGIFRKKLGLPSHRRLNPRRMSEYKRQFMHLYSQKLSDAEIGETLGFDRQTVGHYRRGLGLSAHFTWGHNKIVFSEEQKEEIREMRSSGSSISAIAEKFNIDNQTMIKRCKEMGIDTSKKARAWTRKENEVMRLWGYLEDHGPTTQKEISEKLSISGARLNDYLANLMDFFERFKFSVGTGIGSRGGVKYGGALIYGDLSYAHCGPVISLNDDPRLIDYIAERTPFKLKTSHHVQAFVSHFKKQIGVERAREVVKRMGYVYSDDLKKTPKGRMMKFTDEQLKTLYAKKLNDKQIGAVLGVTNSSIGMRRRRLGLPAWYKKGERSRATYYALDIFEQVEKLE